MGIPKKQFKFSGMIAPHDQLHQPICTAKGAPAPTSAEHYIAPTIVQVTITHPTPPAYSSVLYIPQYSPTVHGEIAIYDPAGNCNGNFMSANFQANNNCYAYGCNITPNTFPQPGRAHGWDLWAFGPINGENVKGGAEADGLVYVGTTMSEVLKFKASRQGTTPPGLLGDGALGGHFVALMISPQGTDSNWPGDYHWARCDNSSGACNSWSQKDGNDQVTNFDFAGQPISDPSTANWTVNQGPVPAPSTDLSPVAPPAQVQSDCVVNYNFYCFMFVPNTGVEIL